MLLPWPLRDARLARLGRRARQGDRQAFRLLYRELQPPVWRFLASRTRDRALAEDLLATTFHRLLEALPTLDPDRPVLPFALAIARNALTDAHRERRPALPVEAAEALPDGAPDPLARLLSAEAARQLRGRLAGLPEEARELLRLRFGDGLRFAEIAALQGTTEPAARQRCSRLVRELRRAADDPSRQEWAHANDL